jgi:aryl-alcohol dehydrogenase-like predicted oxidoreductase|tara:strand:- start:2325 stop:3194 length:870 start_codon:yes stop_codon:yes gene_type:complete
MNSKLILGTVQFGLKYGINNTIGKPKKDEVLSLLKVAYNSGIRILDTAEAYGNAHQLIGNYHKKQDDFKFKIITKFPHQIKHNLIKSKVLEYIDLMNVNTLDVMMFHSFDSFQSNYNSLDTLNELKSDGLINNIGVSVYTNTQLESLLNEDLITVVQLPFNLLDNFNVRGDLINQLKIKGKVIHTRSAFLQGLFFKKYSDDISIVQALKPHLKTLNKITKKQGCSMEELALSYCIKQKNIDNVIIGVDSISQLNANIKAAAYEVSEEALKCINNIDVENLDLLNPSLWK